MTATITDTAGNTLTTTSLLTVTVFPTITPATGGGSISADNFGTGTYVTLTGPIYEEGVSGDIGLGTIILTAPAGFEFATGGPAPTVLVTGSATAADNINNATTGSSLALTAATTSQLTFTVTAESAVPNTLTWQDVRVRPTAGTPLATGDITLDATSTGTLTDVTAGTTSLGALGMVAGALSGYTITAATGTPAAGATDVLTITQVDQYGNTVTGFTGDVVLTFSGLATSSSGNIPTVTDKNGTPVNLGSPTTITFTGGVATVGGTLVAYAAETATLHATDGTYSTATAGGSGATLTVSALAASKLVFTTQPDKVEVNTVFPQQPVVQAQDLYGNLSTVGLGASLNVTLTLSSGSGVLGGTVTLDIGTGAGNGTVTYTNLQLDTAGPARQLTASATGLTDGLSSLFDVWTVYMTSGDVIVADRGPYFSTGTILISRLADPTTAVLITSIKDPYEVAREADGNFLVVDYETSRGGGLFRINKLTFAVSTVSSGGNFKVPFGVKVEASGQILVADLDAFSEAGAVFRVDPVTGVQTTLTQGDQFYFLQGLAIAPTGTPNAGDIYVTSVGDGASITSKLIKIDPGTGAQTVITSAGDLDYPVGMAVEVSGDILVVDALAKKIIRVTPAGVQTVLSDAANGAQGTPFLLPTHVALDAAGDLYVSDGKVNAGVNERLLFKVDKTTGNRVLITQDGFFEQPRGLLLVP